MTSPPLHDGGFTHILNFRDVATTINTYLKRDDNHPLLRQGLLFRAARPDEASPADRARLRDVHRIRTVVDLRSKTEHASAAEKRAAHAAVPTLLQSNVALAEPVQIPGLDYREVRVTGKGFERHLLKQLGWMNFIKLASLHITGYRMEAVAVLCREVMSPRGLLGLAADTLDASGPDIATALRCLLPSSSSSSSSSPPSAPSPLPILYHCTQGKDRTGLLITLILLICAVPVEAVEYDYELTDEKLGEERGERMAEIREMGLSEEFGRTVKGFVPGVKRHLDERHGGLDKYLNAQGFGEGERAKVRELLLC
ncbi:unnamed protein product [Discula destructiva]